MSPHASDPVRSRRLTDISRALTYARSLDEVLELTVDCAMDLLDAGQAVLMLNNDDGLLHIRAARGLAPDVVAQFHEPLDENLLARLTAVLGPDAKDRFLGVPLVVRGAVIGLLGVGCSDVQDRTEEDEWLLSALADQAAVALESTRHQQVRDELADRVENLQRTDRQRTHAFEIIGHDLRSPLNAIVGYAALLQGEILGPINERQREALAKLKKVADHLESIVANVLEMARLSGGRFELMRATVTIAAVAAEARDVVSPAAAAAEIEIALDGDATIRIQTDRGLLRQVLVQLMDNAVKYAPARTRVVLSWSIATADGCDWAELAVSDRGPGIPPDRQKSVFEPYVRQSGESARAQAGVGLGLAIASTIVKRLDGSILVQSEVGSGTVFKVRLPTQ